MYANKLDNIDEMDNFLETHKLPKLTYEEIDNQNRPARSTQNELLIKNISQKKSPGPNGFTVEFHQKSKKEYQSFANSSQKQKRREYLPIYSRKPVLL